MQIFILQLYGLKKCQLQAWAASLCQNSGTEQKVRKEIKKHLVEVKHISYSAIPKIDLMRYDEFAYFTHDMIKNMKSKSIFTYFRSSYCNQAIKQFYSGNASKKLQYVTL